MILKKRSSAAVLFSACVLTGCAVTRSFVGGEPDYEALPMEEMRKIALDIEIAVLQENRDAEIEDGETIRVSGQEVAQAIRTRIARSNLIAEFRALGYAIEKEDGMLYVQRDREYKRETTRRERDRNALLIMSENDDRWMLYEGIRKDSGLPSKALPAIRSAFFEARRQILPDDQSAPVEPEN